MKSQASDDLLLFNGGLNTYIEKAFIDSNQLAYAMNVTVRQPPVLVSRAPRKTLADEIIGEGIPWSKNSNIALMWAYNEGNIYFVREEGEKAYIEQLVRIGNKYDYERLFEIQKAYNGNYYACYACKDNADYLYITTDTAKYRIDHIERGMGIVTELIDDHYGPAVFHKGRLFFAKPGTNVVEYSDYLNFDNFQYGYDEQTQVWYTAGSFPVNSHIGKLTALASFDDKLVIFCEHSMHVLYGEFATDEEDSTAQQVDLNNAVGTLKQDFVAVGGGRMYWYGDDMQIYEYTGSYINMISRPTEVSAGGIDTIFDRLTYPKKLSCSSNTLYINCNQRYLLTYDMYNRIWWCEDGGFATIANYSQDIHNLIIATKEGDILRTIESEVGEQMNDTVYDWSTNKSVTTPIQYEFHLRVYGADGVSSRETLSKVHFQADADAEVFITDGWTMYDAWHPEKYGNSELANSRDVKIGTLKIHPSLHEIEKYNSQNYEQQECLVEKMFGQRLNTFQVKVRGKGFAKFYIMKQDWRDAR